MRGLLAFLVAIFGASAAMAEVPLSLAPTGHFTAPVGIGGADATNWAVDTGAERCGVYARFANGRHLRSAGGATLAGQTGESRAALVVAPAVEIDGQAVGALKCAVLPDGDGAPFDGILGADALQRFVVTFDTRTMQLGLHGGAQHGQALVGPHARLVNVQRLPGALLVVPVRLNGAVGVAVVDTGARRSVFNVRFAEAAGVRTDALRRGEPLQGVSADTMASRAGSLGAFDLAGIVTPAIDGRVADLPAFAALGLADRPAMILGLDRLAGLRLVIDYPRDRIWFDPG